MNSLLDCAGEQGNDPLRSGAMAKSF
jgi:hypothetical protein